MLHTDTALAYARSESRGITRFLEALDLQPAFLRIGQVYKDFGKLKDVEDIARLALR